MSLGAIPGTGPATSPLPVIKKITARTLADLPADRTLVMGILNITEDSFSDGGKYKNADDAISHGLRMYYGGADIIDVGGESTRPGAEPVDPAVEQARILPVITALAVCRSLTTVVAGRAWSSAAISVRAALVAPGPCNPIPPIPPVAPRLIRIAFAASFTSESKPHPAIAT